MATSPFQTRTNRPRRNILVRGCILPRRDSFVAFAVYAVAASLLFGGPLVEGGVHCLCVEGTKDEGIFVWSFAWWPYAIRHGLNPFYTHLIYAPQGFDLAHGTVVPGPALILAPVTEIAGPLFSYNLAMLLSPVLAAYFAFLLCRRLARSFWPALLGGWLFGFSTYMIGQLTEHPNLTLVFLIPAIVHLVLRGIAGEISSRRLVLLLTLALVVQFSISVEVLASLTLFGTGSLCVAYFTSDRDARERIAKIGLVIVAAYVATAVIALPYLYYALQPGGVPVVASSADKFATDLLGPVIPTRITYLGGLALPTISNSFTALFAERDAYLGIPLIVMIAVAIREGRHHPGTRITATALIAIFICSLGAHLHVAGTPTIPLPWILVDRLPGIGLMLPSRFIVYCDLGAALLVATWVGRTRYRWAAWTLAIMAVLSLAPAVRRGYWNSVLPIPKLFTSTAYRQAFRPADTVLVLPVGISGQSMLWQAEAHFGFRMASGYVVPPTAPDPYKHFAIDPTLTFGIRVPHEDTAAATFLSEEHITVAMLAADAARHSPWESIFKHLGWKATVRDGAILFRPI